MSPLSPEPAVLPHAHHPGRLIRWPRRYDLLVGVGLAGRGGRLRAQIGAALSLKPGQGVLDVGCGTGTLTLTLAGRVGPTGNVTGIDASPEMIAAARRKLIRRQVPATFRVAAAQALPFADDTFDAVVASLMIHHLPGADQAIAAREMLRVLRPGGRLVIAEFQAPAGRIRRHLTQHILGHAMANNDLDAIRDLVVGAGATDLRRHPTVLHWLGLISGRKPATANQHDPAHQTKS